MDDSQESPEAARAPGACRCGRVEFDLPRCAPGEVLTCPWCWVQYRYLGGGRIAPLESESTTAATAPATTTAAGTLTAAAPEAVLALPAAAKAPAQSTAERGGKGQEAGAGASPEPSRIEAGPSGGPAAGTSPSGAAARKRVSTRIPGPPGGIWLTILFIAAFNTLALWGAKRYFPELPNGTRSTLLGYPLSRNSTLPEIGALLLGHLTAFAAWLGFLYIVIRRRRRAALRRTGAELPPGTGKGG